jgi:eukaryotic-like serine/threonine-protein kinase
MSPDQERRLEEIFNAARDLPPQERAALLERACGGDAELRRQVDSLLAAHDQAGQFLQPTVALSPLNGLLEKSGDRIGRYKLLQRIGEGGFGVVYMAEQEEPVRRRVALKIIKLGMDTKEVVARFDAERQALAMMDHPNIARVFDGGATDTGRPYFVMELVKGVPITDYCDANKLSTRERLELFMQVCHAVQHAHLKGVIHRDLKPSNVLVTEQDDRPVPKVIDFGVAKATQARLTEKTLFTRFNQWIGTPAYMSPEQAGLGSLDVDTRSDVYSLGVLLYELLTGRTPLDTQKLLAAGYDAVMRTIREEDPPKPSARLSTLAQEELSAVAASRGAEPARLNRLVRGDLDWIAMKALEKDRIRRYETANAFARDVAAYLEQEPVSAAAPSAAYRARRFIARNRLVVGFSTALALTLVIGIVISAWQTARALRFAKESERARNQTEAGAYASRVVLASQRMEAGDLTQANRLLEACPAPLRQFEWHYLKRQCQPACQVLEGQSNEVVRLDASPDGHWLASLGKYGDLVLWSLEGDFSQPARTWPELFRLETLGNALAFSHDARRLVYTRPVGKAKWALGVVSLGGAISEQELLRTSGEKLRPLCLSFSPDDRFIIVASSDGVIRSYDASNGREEASYPILAAAFSPDGARAVSMGVAVRLPRLGERHKPPRDLRAFDTSTARELLAITNLSEPAALLSLAISPDGNRVAAGFVEMTVPNEDAIEQSKLGQRWREKGSMNADRGWVVVWDFSTGKEILRHKLTNVGPMDLHFSSEGYRLAIACARLEISEEEGWPGLFQLANPGSVVIVDLRSGEKVASLHGHLADVTSVVFIPGGNRLASGSSDRTVRLWELGTSRVIPLGGDGNTSLSSDGQRITVGTLEGTLDVVELATGRTLASVRPAKSQLNMSPSFDTCVVGLAWLSDYTLHYWDFRTASEAWSVKLGFGAARMACSRDSRWLALADEPKQGSVCDIALLEAGIGKLIFRKEFPEVCDFAFSPDNRFLVVGDACGTVHLWKTQSGDEVFRRRATEPRPGASLVDFLSERGKPDPDKLKGLDAPALGIPVTAVAVSPDGTLLATAAGMMTAELRLWNIATGQPKWIGALAATARAVAFSPDGHRLAVAWGWVLGQQRGVGIFDVASGQQLLALPSSALIESLAFSPDGARLWGVTAKSTLVFWEASPWPGPVTPPAVALKPSVVENHERKSSTRP